VVEREAFDLASVERAWKEFAEGLKEEGKQGPAAALASAKLELAGTMLSAEWLNEVQLSQIADFRAALCAHLRVRVRNGALELEVRVRPQDAPERAVFLTDRDRYEAFVAANPAVDELRRRLDLDFA
jgi:hypothetical protein